MLKKALITGITGQDGSYLAELLLEKGYIVYGLHRYVSERDFSTNTKLKNILKNESFFLINGDLTDSISLLRIIKEIEPDEIYNLASLSHVKVSFDVPEYTANVNALGTLRILECLRTLGLEKKTKYYQASTSELFGFSSEPLQKESTPFNPKSPYACAKLYAYWITINYRQSYNLFAVNGILFNHESPRRGKDFVTRKITTAAARIKLGLQKELYLGNLSAERDFGHAKDYVVGIWKMLQQDTPKDFVLASGQAISIRNFCKKVFFELGYDIDFKGTGLDEVGIDKNTGKRLIFVDEKLFRPIDVNTLKGDAKLARKELGWNPKYNIDSLIKEMVREDLLKAEMEKSFLL